MKAFHNIEKSAFKAGEYVGYANGEVYRIMRDGKRWLAVNRRGADSFVRYNLADISAALEATAAMPR